MNTYQSISGRVKGLILIIILFLLALFLSCQSKEKSNYELSDQEIVNLLEETRKPLQEKL